MEIEVAKTKCIKCKNIFEFDIEDAYWNEAGTYSVKLIKCPECGCITPVKYIEASGLYVNTDKRYYE